jgi:phosphoribosylformylglycinamidine synthase
MANKPKVLVLRTAGTNCNVETTFAFTRCGADVDEVHIEELLARRVSMKDYHILALPGGFSYGDDIASGRVFANELRVRLGDDVARFIADKKLIIGICNGFQILVKSGILPGPFEAGSKVIQTATLFNNDSGKFEDRWVHLKTGGKCVWTAGMPERIFIPVAHGEGKFIPASPAVLKTLKEQGRIVFAYVAADGGAPEYPANPNGSTDHIAGITDPTGRILGLMPHPERHFWATQHPFWTRLERKSKFGDGAPVFQNGVDYVKRHLL